MSGRPLQSSSPGFSIRLEVPSQQNDPDLISQDSPSSGKRNVVVAHGQQPMLTFDPTRESAIREGAGRDAGSKQLASGLQHDFDMTGQDAPAGIEPHVTAMVWEDEDALCIQVVVRGVYIARRVDNDMVNGTKLLKLVSRRDSMLESEATRHVVKVGPKQFKGVWIPLDRALELANTENITGLLYPLFVDNIGVLLYNPVNLPRISQIIAAAEFSKQSRQSGLGFSDPKAITSQETTSSKNPTHPYQERQLLDRIPSTQEQRSQPLDPMVGHLEEIFSAANLSDNPNAISRDHNEAPPKDLTHEAGPADNSASESSSSTSELSATVSISSGDDQNVLALDGQKRLLLDRLMGYFHSVFSSYDSPNPYVHYHGGRAGEAPSTTSGYHDTSHQSQEDTSDGFRGIYISPKALGKRHANNDEDDDDPSNKKVRLESKAPTQEPARRFACPFFKNNPQCYRTWRAGCANSADDELLRYEQFLRRELPDRVRQQLEQRINERPYPLEESLRSELVEIVRDTQLQLFELYKPTLAGAAAAAVPERAGEPQVGLAVNPDIALENDYVGASFC